MLRELWKTEDENARMLHGSTAVVGGLIVHYYTPYEPDVSVVRALRLDGSTAWTGEWPFFMCFHVHRDSLYFGGDAARRVEIATGRVLAERRFETDVEIQPPIATGPVFVDAARVIGLHPDDLSTLWEVPDPDEELVAHHGRLCRYRTDGRMSHVDLTTLQETTSVQAPPHAGAEFHTHVGHLWCVFHHEELGRMAIDERSGEVRWRFGEPRVHAGTLFHGNRAFSQSASGLSAFDLSDGQLLWTQAFGNPPRSLHGPLHLQDGFAYGGIQNTYNDRTIVVIDLETGGVLLDHPVDYTVEAVRPIGAGHLVAGWQHGIVCYEVS